MTSSRFYELSRIGLLPMSRASALRWGVVAGLLGVQLAVGYASVRWSFRLAIAAAVVPLALVVLLRGAEKLEWGVILIFGSAAFVRFSIPTGTESTIVASLAVTGVIVVLWLVKMMAAEKRLHLKPAPTNLPLLAFLAVAVISLVWSIVYRDPLVVVWSSFPFVQFASLVVTILLPAVFLMMGNLIEDVRWLKILVGLVLFNGVLGFFQQYLRVPVPVNVLGIFPMWAAAIASAWALFDRKLSWWQRMLLLAFAMGWVLYGYPRRVTWLAAWVPTFAALAVIGIRRWRWAIIVVLIVFIFVAQRYVEVNYQGEIAESGQSRWAAWVQNWEVTGRHLLFGTGPAGYAVYYMSYYPDTAMASHSNYVDVLAQHGIVGLFFFLWFLAALLWWGYQICRRLEGRFDFLEGMANAVFAGTVGCVVAMAIGDWMLPFAYTQTIEGFEYVVYNWLMIGVIPVLDFLTRSQADQGKPLGKHL